MLLLCISILAIGIIFAGRQSDIAVATEKSKSGPSILPVTIKYRGGDVSSDGGSYPRSVTDPIDLYYVGGATTVLIAFGAVSGYLIFQRHRRKNCEPY